MTNLGIEAFKNLGILSSNEFKDTLFYLCVYLQLLINNWLAEYLKADLNCMNSFCDLLLVQRKLTSFTDALSLFNERGWLGTKLDFTHYTVV